MPLPLLSTPSGSCLPRAVCLSVVDLVLKQLPGASMWLTDSGGSGGMYSFKRGDFASPPSEMLPSSHGSYFRLRPRGRSPGRSLVALRTWIEEAWLEQRDARPFWFTARLLPDARLLPGLPAESSSLEESVGVQNPPGSWTSSSGGSRVMNVRPLAITVFTTRGEPWTSLTSTFVLFTSCPTDFHCRWVTSSRSSAIFVCSLWTSRSCSAATPCSAAWKLEPAPEQGRKSEAKPPGKPSSE
mmetsp:Transcript_92303/g.257879  ORF Transcript_92303/g.257879 Transcript_92303/m.257879 type:complete len:241 (-) Transcript_92303:157-879(-)